MIWQNYVTLRYTVLPDFIIPSPWLRIRWDLAKQRTCTFLVYVRFNLAELRISRMDNLRSILPLEFGNLHIFDTQSIKKKKNLMYFVQCMNITLYGSDARLDT